MLRWVASVAALSAQGDSKRGHRTLWGRFSKEGQGGGEQLNRFIDSVSCLYWSGFFEPGQVQVYSTYVQFHPQLGGCARRWFRPCDARGARRGSRGGG